MTKVQLSIKEVDEEVFKEFKAESIKYGVKIGKALTLAMEMWLENSKRKPKLSLRDFKPWSWGPGTERISEEIDKVLYEWLFY
mgnify:CR=1 FL=1